MIKQRTLKTPVTATGVGLHSGVKVEMTLRPAAPDSGIVFRRVDLEPPAALKADPYLVTDTRLCSMLESGPAKVATVESFRKAIAAIPKGKSAAILVRRGEGSLYVPLKISGE